jgi:hypothetical protein
MPVATLRSLLSKHFMMHPLNCTPSREFVLQLKTGAFGLVDPPEDGRPVAFHRLIEAHAVADVFALYRSGALDGSTVRLPKGVGATQTVRVDRPEISTVFAPADLSIVAWLEHVGCDYEVLADEEVRRAGAATGLGLEGVD